MKHTVYTVFSLVLILMAITATNIGHADGIRRIQHADGTVEFTNVGGNKQARPSTRNETVYRYTDERGVVSYTNQKPDTRDFDVIRFHCYACDPDSTVDWHNTPLYTGTYREEITTAAREYDVDPALVDPDAVSPVGAQGLMQLMPGTARELGVTRPFEARENIRGGANYLSQMLDRFGGDIRLATAAYNAGPGAVSRYKGVPPYAETKAYVNRVGILHQRYAAN